MASEDSQHLGWLAKVHGLDDLRDLHQTRWGEVVPKMHEFHDLSELGEILSLRGSQRVALEEGDDLALQVLQSEDAVDAEILSVVVVSAVAIDAPAPEVPHQVFEHVTARDSLDDLKSRLHLPSEGHRAVSLDGTAEATFAIHESNNPSVGDEPFLLVFRTPRIVTGFHAPDDPSGVKCDVQAE
jgi:hypothetical protein